MPMLMPITRAVELLVHKSTALLLLLLWNDAVVLILCTSNFYRANGKIHRQINPVSSTFVTYY